MPSLAVRDAVLDHDVAVLGPPGAAPGPAVVQLHGLTSSRERDHRLGLDVMRGLADPAGGTGARLLRYDARGHGRSSGSTTPGDYRWDRLAEDLLALLATVFPGEVVHGCGPSMGTGTLLHAAVRDPGRFASLVLVVPPTAWETRRERCAVYEEQAVLVERAGIDAFVAASGAAPPPAAADAPATLPDVEEDLLPTVLRGAALTDLPGADALAVLDVPILTLAWTEDPTHPLATAEALTGLLPQGELVVAGTPAERATWPRLAAEHVRRAAARGARRPGPSA